MSSRHDFFQKQSFIFFYLINLRNHFIGEYLDPASTMKYETSGDLWRFIKVKEVPSPEAKLSDNLCSSEKLFVIDLEQKRCYCNHQQLFLYWKILTRSNENAKMVQFTSFCDEF